MTKASFSEQICNLQRKQIGILLYFYSVLGTDCTYAFHVPKNLAYIRIYIEISAFMPVYSKSNVRRAVSNEME